MNPFASYPLNSRLVRAVLGFLAIALLCLVFADVAVTTLTPWDEFARLARGVVTPDFFATEDLWIALLNTIAFALLGVTLAIALGFLLAVGFGWRAVRVFCAVVRGVHELFWALIFLQVFGLSPLTGILAIGIPYAGIIAKVYAEILEEADPRPLAAMPPGTGRISAFLFVRMPDVFVHFRAYALYRLECGLRSSAVLGFVGLPTLGFHLESAFRQGHYSEVSALLILFYVIIAGQRIWVRRPLLPLYLIAAVFLLPWSTPISGANVVRFFTQDIVPYPLRSGAGLDGLGEWVWMLFSQQALPGAVATVQLSMVALVATGILAAAFFPLVSPVLLPRPTRWIGNVFLVVVRSTPEYILAFILLQLWGPSMLPAIVALSLHNAGIIGHLVGRYSESIRLRPDAARGANRYLYEVLPRVYRPMLALLFYRWEVIMRETAILGMLGVFTLGFFIDSAFAELRFDRALFLIGLTALLNIAVDAVSRAIRERLRLRTALEGR